MNIEQSYSKVICTPGWICSFSELKYVRAELSFKRHSCESFTCMPIGPQTRMRVWQKSCAVFWSLCAAKFSTILEGSRCRIVALSHLLYCRSLGKFWCHTARIRRLLAKRMIHATRRLNRTNEENVSTSIRSPRTVLTISKTMRICTLHLRMSAGLIEPLTTASATATATLTLCLR